MSIMDEKRNVSLKYRLGHGEGDFVFFLSKKYRVSGASFLRFILIRVSMFERLQCLVNFEKPMEELVEMAEKERRSLRTQVLVTRTESAIIENCARRYGMTVSSFIRFVVVRVATNLDVEMQVLSGIKSPEQSKRIENERLPL